jgi:putative ABC transport system substrate-binding protein
VRRREFIAGLGSAAVWPVAARAQQAGAPVIGYVYSGAEGSGGDQAAAFRKGLSESGFVEGRNVMIEYRWANNEYDRLPELAADLVRHRVAVIAAMGGTPAALAAKAATETIPIVFSASDPVQSGLVASLNRPGGNVTGINTMNSQLMAKRLGLLHELLPEAARIAVLVNSNNPFAGSNVRDLQAAAVTLGRQIEVLAAGTNREIDTALASLVQKRADALLVGPESLFVTRRVQPATAAMRYAVPAIYAWRESTEAGGLMSYGANLADLSRQAGIYVGRILKGEKPADLPVLQPTKFEFVINLQTARLLGIDVPETLLATADEVIQ